MAKFIITLKFASPFTLEEASTMKARSIPPREKNKCGCMCQSGYEHVRESFWDKMSSFCHIQHNIVNSRNTRQNSKHPADISSLIPQNTRICLAKQDLTGSYMYMWFIVINNLIRKCNFEIVQLNIMRTSCSCTKLYIIAIISFLRL